MFRRFFQGLKQGVKGVATEAMHFVYDVNFIGAFAGGKGNLVAQFTDIVDAGMRGGVNFDEIEISAFVDGDAIGAGIAGTGSSVFAGAIDRFRQ